MSFNQERYNAVLKHFITLEVPPHLALPAARVVALDEPGVDRTPEQQAKVTAVSEYLTKTAIEKDG
jgi:hypothetical protein